jgi:hypothetical protein
MPSKSGVEGGSSIDAYSRLLTDDAQTRSYQNARTCRATVVSTVALFMDHFFLDFVFGCFNDGFSAFLCGYE